MISKARVNALVLVASAMLPFCGAPALAQQPPLWLWVNVTNRSAHAEQEAMIPRALAQASPALEGILLFAPAWQESPGIASSPIVRRILTECEIHGLKVIWARHLWVTWDGLTDGRPQRATDQVTASYYVAAMQHLAAEAAAMGAVGSCLDAEPYGGVIRDALKVPVEIPPALHLRMAEAIELAKLYAPAPSFVTPGYHRLPTHWRWVFSHLTEVLSRTTYRAREPDHIHVRPNPPLGHTFNITWPGWWVVSEPWTAESPTPPPLTVDEFRALDWSDWRSAEGGFPNIEAVWIFVDSADLPEVCRQLGDGA